MSRSNSVSVSFDDFLKKKDDPYPLDYREVIVVRDRKLSFVDICNAVLRFSDDMRFYLACVIKGFLKFETEEGTLFVLSIPNITLREDEEVWFSRLLEQLSLQGAGHVVEKVSSWYKVREGYTYLTVSKSPKFDYSMSVKVGENGWCELIVSANVRYHYYLSESDTQGEIDRSLYEDTKIAFREFSQTFEDLGFLKKLEKKGIFFVSNEQYSSHRGGIYADR